MSRLSIWGALYIIYIIIYIYILAHISLYIYSMKVDYVELVPVVKVGERVSVGLLFLS